MEIGAQIYSLRAQIKTEAGVIKAFEYLKKIGAETVELAAMPKMSEGTLSALSKRTGVKIISSHSSFSDIRKNIKSLIAEHLACGAEYIGISGIPIKYVRSRRGAQKFVKIMNEAASESVKSGIKMIYHNHSFEFKKKYLNGETLFDTLLNGFSENVKFCLDCYWADNAGANVPSLIEKLGEKLSILHCKDLPEGGTVNGYKMCAPGRGILDYAAYLTAAKKVGCRHALVELDECSDPEEELAYGVDALKKIIAENI